jgi:hypothetical protein
VGHRHRVGPLALPERRGLDHPAEQPSQQRLRGVRRAAHQQRHRVAQAPLELAYKTFGFDQPATLGGLADQDLAVRLDEEHRRHLGRSVAKRQHAGSAVTLHRSRGVGRAEVHTQPVTHARLHGGSVREAFELSVANENERHTPANPES